MRFFIRNRCLTIAFPKPRAVVMLSPELRLLNGHYISSGGEYKSSNDMWPIYGVCFRCGMSILNGADAWFSSVSCDEFKEGAER